MLKVRCFFIVIQLTVLNNCLNYRHDLWSTKDEELAKITDITWNYCDLKCLYLENYLPNADFVVLKFNKVDTLEQYADCYVAQPHGYVHWSKMIKNTMYSQICWDQQGIDMIAQPADYQLTSVEGQGIGAQI